MKRRKQPLTSEEIEKRKQLWWGPTRNARRRERYASDQAYREKAIKQVRETYRRTREAEGASVRQEDCRENLPKLFELGRVRTIRVSGQQVKDNAPKKLTFTLEELAKTLGRNTQVLYRWLSDDMIPAPLYEALNERNRWQGVYTEDEVTAIVQIFGKHQEISQYYRTFHENTRNSIHSAVKKLRNSQQI